MRLFQWKAENAGKEVVLLAGAGLTEGCVAAETRLQYKLLVPLLPEEEEQEEEEGRGGEKGRKKNKKGARGEQVVEEEDVEDKKKRPKKATRRLVGLEQVSTGYCMRRVAFGCQNNRNDVEYTCKAGSNSSWCVCCGIRGSRTGSSGCFGEVDWALLAAHSLQESSLRCCYTVISFRVDPTPSLELDRGRNWSSASFLSRKRNCPVPRLKEQQFSHLPYFIAKSNSSSPLTIPS